MKLFTGILMADGYYIMASDFIPAVFYLKGIVFWIDGIVDMVINGVEVSVTYCVVCFTDFYFKFNTLNFRILGLISMVNP